MMKKNLFSRIIVTLLCVSLFLAGCAHPTPSTTTPSPSVSQNESGVTEATAKVTSTIPKYVFMFIGDGMSFPQVTAYGMYTGTVKNNFKGTVKEPTPENMPQTEMPSFVDFPVVGAATTQDASKFVTDSASAATAIASGVKTLDGAIGVDPYNNPVPTIAELIKKNTDYKVGIITSVSLDHATPAGFYAHVASRDNYYDIGKSLIDSDFDFFGGGGFKQPTGKEKDQPNLMDLAKEAGYNVANTYDEISALNASSGKSIAVNPVLDNSSDAALNYGVDRDSSDLQLADYVQKGIEVLGDEKGFFMMVEGGKIDWACHANDAYTTIREVEDLDNAVKVAVDFANKHPEETLILVTGDHETGGFSMGFNGTAYDTYFDLLSGQQMSYKAFADTYVKKFREENVPFETAMQDVKTVFGLVMPTDPDAENAGALLLSDREVTMLREAYAESMVPYADRDRDAEYKLRYSISSAEPLQIIVTHILNNRAGFGWTTTGHSGLPVAVFAKGVGQENFGDFYDNTDIFVKLKAIMGL